MNSIRRNLYLYANRDQVKAIKFGMPQSNWCSNQRASMPYNPSAEPNNKPWGIVGAHVAGGTAAGALTGSAVLPGIGTAVGAAVGMLGGLFTGAVNADEAVRAYERQEKEKSNTSIQEAERRAKNKAEQMAQEAERRAKNKAEQMAQEAERKHQQEKAQLAEKQKSLLFKLKASMVAALLGFSGMGAQYYHSKGHRHINALEPWKGESTDIREVCENYWYQMLDGWQRSQKKLELASSKDSGKAIKEVVSKTIISSKTVNNKKKNKNKIKITA